MKLRLICLILSGFLITKPVLAGDPPIQISPANNSTITSTPALSWQAVPGSTGYNILIDDEPTITSPYAKTPYYPTNPGYSPNTLNPGTYYWKVKTKDSNGTWGSFSSTWSFTLSASTPTPTPAATPTPSPSSTPTPADTPQPTSSFTITPSQTQITSDQSFTVSVNITSGETYYCKGAFKKADSSNYFGLTKVSGNWIKNSSSYTNQYPCSNNFNLEIKPDVDDSGYTGSGDYIFKVARYDTDGGNLTWSNENTININNISTADSSTPTTTQIIPSTKSTDPVNPTFAPSTSKSNISLKNDYRVASVAGAAIIASASASASSSATIEVKDQRQTNPMIWIGLIFILAGAGSIGYIYFKKNAKPHLWFRR